MIPAASDHARVPVCQQASLLQLAQLCRNALTQSAPGSAIQTFVDFAFAHTLYVIDCTPGTAIQPGRTANVSTALKPVFNAHSRCHSKQLYAINCC